MVKRSEATPGEPGTAVVVAVAPVPVRGREPQRGTIYLEFDGHLREVGFYAPGARSAGETALVGYREALLHRLPRGTTQVTLRVTNAVIDGHVYRGHEVSSPGMLRAWVELLRTVDVLSGIVVESTNGDGRRVVWTQAAGRARP